MKTPWLKHRQGDVTAAIANFLEAAKLGCTAALFAAASLLDTDDADEKDMEQALSLYQKGISEGDVQAMYNFAYKLTHGENIAVDKTRAITLFERAFKTWKTTRRNPDHLHSASGALLELGNHYLQQGNHAAAIDYYQQAIGLGQHRAYFGLITHAYPESLCSGLGLARAHAPSALKNMESGSWRRLNLKVYSDKYGPRYFASTP